jgi:hypothetical protein
MDSSSCVCLTWAEQQPLETGERSVLPLKQSDQTKQ